jgi:multisubunit Na+/H+ antiporter MnhB subunit
MPGAELLFDMVLGILMVALAIGAINAPRLYTAVVLFIAMGLLLALTWARLGAADLALAEAAIGAGLTGVLLLIALSRSEPESLRTPRPGRSGVALLGSALLLAILWHAVLPLADMPTRLPQLAQDALPQSGVDHAVTAVLLNYRAWDTLLELVVLLLALLGVRQLRPAPAELPTAWPILQVWVQFLAPVAVTVAAYLLWRGSHAPGGAFQAGALLAAGAVLLRLTGALPVLRWEQLAIRTLVLGGVGLFLAVGILTAWQGDGWLTYPVAWSGPLILLIEVAATLSIAASLTLLVLGDRRELGQ